MLSQSEMSSYLLNCPTLFVDPMPFQQRCMLVELTVPKENVLNHSVNVNLLSFTLEKLLRII